jgi:hypothetical protein
MLPLFYLLAFNKALGDFQLASVLFQGLLIAAWWK